MIIVLCITYSGHGNHLKIKHGHILIVPRPIMQGFLTKHMDICIRLLVDQHKNKQQKDYNMRRNDNNQKQIENLKKRF